MADDFAERAERQQRRHQRDLVDVDDPDHVGGADMKIGGDGGEGDVGDCGIERRHRDRDEDRGNRPAPAFGGQTVMRRRSLRRARNFRHCRECSRPGNAAV
jgi:hypothetical protein